MERIFVSAAAAALVLMGCGGGKGADTDSDAGADVLDEEVADVGGEDLVEEEVPPAETECAVDGDCDDSDPCTTDGCDTESGDCVHVPVDADGDGFTAASVGTEDCGGTDCDDSDDAVFPGSDARRCGEDGDCNGHLDDDNDDDGYDRTDCGGGDCDDEDPELSPAAEPGCGMDSSDPLSDLDCNGNVDADNDDDGQYDVDCTSTVTDDCDDSDPDVYFGADEVCLDGVDQDCDGYVDGAMALGSDVRVTTSGVAYSHSLAWTGSEYGLAFDDSYYGPDRIHFQRIGVDGALVGSSIAISDASGSCVRPTLTWTGSEYGLAWVQASDGDADIRFTRLSGLGAEMGTETWLVQNAVQADDAMLVWAGSQYGLCWRHDEDGATGDDRVAFARFAADGTALGSSTFVTSAAAQPYAPACVWTGTAFALAWADSRDGDGEIYFGALDGSGVPIGSEVRVTSAAGESQDPAIAWTGSEFGLVWQDSRSGSIYRIFVNRLDATGHPLASDTQLTSGSTMVGEATIAWEGGRFVLVWTEQSGPDQQIVFGQLDASFTGFYAALTSTAGQSYMPVVASTGSEVGLAWIDARTGPLENYFNRLGFCQ